MNAHCRTWKKARHKKMWKMRNTHFKTRNMARNTEKAGK